MKKTYLKLLMYLMMLFPLSILAQNSVSGTITNASTGESLAFVNVLKKGTTNGVASDINGNFTLDVSSFPVTLVFSSIGFTTKELIVNSSSTITVSMEEGSILDEIVLIGNRSKPRTVLNSPVPIDNIGIAELIKTGQPTIDKMLTYKIPSFNSTNQTVSDATAHFDPADLRGLGPSRTLVLINGKRKNQSALVYLSDTPGKGEVGVDLKSIPAAALKRIEVLRDGASAQYGSDAIAGVINMVLRDDVGDLDVNITSGVTTQGDGFNAGIDLNKGFSVGDNGGFLNLTLAYYQQDKTNRAGEPGGDGLFGFLYDVGAIPIGAAGGFESTTGVTATGNDILTGNTDWQRANPDLGVIIGQPILEKTDGFYNLGLPFKSGNGKFYSFGGLTYRNGKSFAIYRAPYWPGIPTSAADNPLYDGNGPYQGFHPTFETKIIDNNITAGIQWKLSGFDVDLSETYGKNSVDYTVNNSINTSLGSASPTSFDVGAYSYSNLLSNLDLSRSFDEFSIAFGAELRSERFEAIAGEPDSYTGGGIQSFPGLQPSNAVKAKRNNLGLYGELEWEPTTEFLIGAAIRYEDFSDFGDNTSWKINARQLLGDNNGAIRASYSTGFRAPSLHQIYLSNIQTLISGGTISNQGTFNNVDPIIREGLGVPQLTAETSKNLTLGFTYKLDRNFSISADFYNVKVADRVLFTGEVGFDGDDDTTNPVEQILIDHSVTSLKFFINAVDTKTTGIDLVANYNNIGLGKGSLDFTLSANFNKTVIDGEIATPAILAASNYDIFNRKEQARIISARPKSKILLGLDYEINKWSFTLNNTSFGEVTWQHASDPTKDQTFASKVVTDFIIGYSFSNKVSAWMAINNLLDVYPDVIDTKGDFITDLGGRFKYPWEVNQFGFKGTIINFGLNFKL